MLLIKVLYVSRYVMYKPLHIGILVHGDNILDSIGLYDPILVDLWSHHWYQYRYAYCNLI